MIVLVELQYQLKLAGILISHVAYYVSALKVFSFRAFSKIYPSLKNEPPIYYDRKY